MKYFNLVIVFAISCSVMQAQTELTINPIGIFNDNFSIGADFQITEKFSLEATVGIGIGKQEEIDFKYYNLPVNLFGKLYLKPKHGMDRFYFSAFARFVTRRYAFDGDGSPIYAEYTQTRAGLGLGMGYKFLIKKKVVIDIGFGLGHAFIDHTKVRLEGEEWDIDWPKLLLAGKLGIGYRFGGK